MGGSLPLATQFHGEGGLEGRMDATTGTPWAFKSISWSKTNAWDGKLEYEVTNAWAHQLSTHGPPAPS